MSDLVSRNAAINAIWKAMTAPHWIPCKKRLPEKDGNYLVTDDSGGVAWVTDTFFIKCDEDSKPFWGLANVVAWMPLPEAYKEETNE